MSGWPMINFKESMKSSDTDPVLKHVCAIKALVQQGDHQTKGMACAVKVFGSRCLVSSSDVDCEKPFIMDRYSRFHSGKEGYRLDSSVVECKTFKSFSFLRLKEDKLNTRGEQCKFIFDLPLEVPSKKQGTFDILGFGKSFTLDPKKTKLDNNDLLGSPIVENQAVVGVVGLNDNRELSPFFIEHEILGQLKESLKDVNSGCNGKESEEKAAIEHSEENPGETTNVEDQQGGESSGQPVQATDGRTQPSRNTGPVREKRDDNDTDEIDQGKTSIEETCEPEKIPSALGPRNIASGKEDASSRLSTSVLAIPRSVYRKMCIKLNNKDEISFQDFRMLGEKLGFDKTVTRALEDETTANPTDELLWDWCAVDGDKATVKKLIQLLKEKDLERTDVVGVLEDWLKQVPYSELPTKVSEIPCETYSRICLMLNVKRPRYNDYRILGEKLKYSRVQIEGFEQGKTDPTDKLIKKGQTKGDVATVARLIELVKGMKRMDVVKILEDWVNTGLAAE